MESDQVLPRCSDGEPDELCDRCDALDLGAALSAKRDDEDDFIPITIADLEGKFSESCAMCRLLVECRGKNNANWLFSKSLGKIEPSGTNSEIERTRVLFLAPNSLSFGYNTQGFVAEALNDSEKTRCVLRCVESKAVNYSLIRSWLDFCNENHLQSDGYTCKPREVDIKWPLRMIDCRTRLVVPLKSLGTPCPPFCALSYVWGMKNNGLDQQDHGRLPQNLPQTITDSITVTKELGFRYLWVDKYCILQNDEEDKRIQIGLMAEVYGAATITIIAAAGSDPTYGLPGVSSTARVPQPRVKLKDRILTWTLEDPKVLVGQSVWTTRAWTYQEALLSPRRLVFTDHQVYFQCSEMATCEALSRPFKVSYTLERDYSEIFPWAVGGGTSRSLNTRIREYTQKELSNDSDILNGFQGILSYCAQRYNSINLWGIAVGSNGFPTENIFLYSLFWTLEKPGTRRKGFPSWSWAGWRGAVNYIPHVHYDFFSCPRLVDLDIGVAIETPDGNIRISDVTTETSAWLQRNNFYTLNIESFFIPIEIKQDDMLGLIVKASLKNVRKCIMVGKFCPLVDVELEDEVLSKSTLRGVVMSFKGPHVVEEDWSFYSPRPDILVIRDIGGVWERIGHADSITLYTEDAEAPGGSGYLDIGYEYEVHGHNNQRGQGTTCHSIIMEEFKHTRTRLRLV